MTSTVLVVDDEKNIRRTIRMVLEGEDVEVLEAGSAEEAIELVRAEDLDAVILDVRLPGMTGVEALKKLRAQKEQVPVVMVSGHASIADAVEAVREGATDFLEKPLDRDRLLVSVRNALRTGALEKEVRVLKRNARKRYEMVGESAVMKRLFAEIEKVAPTKGRVLVTGESGTGKELIARAIHRLSPRAEKPFVKVNCAAIPADLIESELFGHERGSFTGAVGKKKGLFEVAHTGTLFLDEIGDMAPNAQAKVLRALQSGEITRVGGEQVIAVDVRVVAATNKDLDAAVAAGEFREDLFFRLNVIPLRSPSLRERPEDVPLLAKSFLVEFCEENGMKPKPFEADVLEALSERGWPGNVRELRNVVERMAILSDDTITLDDLPELPRRQIPAEQTAALPTAIAGAEGPRETLREYRERAERQFVLDTLERFDWNISRAAVVLGVERTNLHKKMRSLGIKRDGAAAP
ncbi:MAG: sigma-54-dependent Fis family transcriptional regulator [Deltaproteobacteria bacterium]|nr:sigma-54-dependent Fis family transcriptional regulator [Deltaproteobacteria bacterium]